ncbi:MAG: MBL fold metallo-hydrolase [Gammaproteobacteria bacterium]|nr:MBL fold metallo-hydrolase [Gammaproteobacteria bacterium]
METRSGRHPSAALDYCFDATPPLGATLEVRPGVHWLRLPLPFALDHINVWLLADGDGWTLVDTGVGLAEVETLWQRALPALTAGRPLRRILVTHHHPDHLGLAAWLQALTGAPVWMTAASIAAARVFRDGVAVRRLDDTRRFYAAHGLSDFESIAGIESGRGYNRIVPALPGEVRPVADGETIAIGGHDWRALVVGGHAEGHLVLHCAELALIITGDQILPTITSNISVRPDDPDGNPLGAYLDDMQRFASLADDTVVLPSHGRVFRGLHARIAQIESHHGTFLQRVRRECRRPRSVAELLPKLFLRELDPLNTVLAFGETLAHLNCLWRAGRVERQGAAPDLWRWRQI